MSIVSDMSLDQINAARIGELQRSLRLTRWLTLGTLVLALVLAVLLLLPKRELRVRNVVLVDDAGVERGHLGIVGDMSMLRLGDESGLTRWRLIGGKSPLLEAYDDKDKSIISLGTELGSTILALGNERNVTVSTMANDTGVFAATMRLHTPESEVTASAAGISTLVVGPVLGDFHARVEATKTSGAQFVLDNPDGAGVKLSSTGNLQALRFDDPTAGLQMSLVQMKQGTLLSTKRSGAQTVLASDLPGMPPAPAPPPVIVP